MAHITIYLDLLSEIKKREPVRIVDIVDRFKSPDRTIRNRLYAMSDLGFVMQKPGTKFWVLKKKGEDVLKIFR